MSTHSATIIRRKHWLVAGVLVACAFTLLSVLRSFAYLRHTVTGTVVRTSSIDERWGVIVDFDITAAFAERHLQVADMPLEFRVTGQRIKCSYVVSDVIAPGGPWSVVIQPTHCVRD